MIAFLTKEGIDARLLYAIPFSLLFYAGGVFFGAMMMYFATEAMDQWNMYWEARVNKDVKAANKYERRAGNWWRGYRCSFVLSIFCFCLASVVLAAMLSWYWPPVDAVIEATAEPQ